MDPMVFVLVIFFTTTFFLTVLVLAILAPKQSAGVALRLIRDVVIKLLK